MIIRLFLFLLLPVFAYSQDISGAFIGLAGGQNKAFHVDIAIPMYQTGYTAWGFHVSLDQRTPQSEGQIPNYTPDKTLWGTQQTRENESKGASMGAFLNVGRGFVIVGVSSVTQQNEVVKVWQDGTTELIQNQQEKKIAQYATLGYHIGKVTIYGSYSTHYKAAVGIGFNW